MFVPIFLPACMNAHLIMCKPKFVYTWGHFILGSMSMTPRLLQTFCVKVGPMPTPLGFAISSQGGHSKNFKSHQGLPVGGADATRATRAMRLHVTPSNGMHQDIVWFTNMFNTPIYTCVWFRVCLIRCCPKFAI